MECRTSSRARCLFGGFVAFNRGRNTVDCQIRNLSTDGALLDFASGALVPHRFQLLTAQVGVPVQAEVVWRAGSRCGVAFSPVVATAKRSPLDLAGRLSAYQAPSHGLRAGNA